MLLIQNMNKDTMHYVECTLDQYITHMSAPEQATGFICCDWETIEQRTERFLEWCGARGWIITEAITPNTYALHDAPVPYDPYP